MLKPCYNRSFSIRWRLISRTIAATDYALKAVIVPFIAALKPMAPGIRVRIIPESPATLLAQTERGEVDIALLTPTIRRRNCTAGRCIRKSMSVCCAKTIHRPTSR